MGGRHEQVQGAHGFEVRLLKMDCWDRFFFDFPELSPPGREEAIKRAIQRSEERKAAKECRKPRGRGKG